MKLLAQPVCRKKLDYIELPHEVGNDRLRFMTVRLLRIKCCDVVPPGRILSFRDADSHEVLRADDHGFVLAEGFKWNGCSPKRYIPVLGWVGTPDFHPSTIVASALHDCLYQFNKIEGFPWTREQCDDIFKQIIESYGEHELASVYHFFVRHLGSWDGAKKAGLRMIRL